MSPQGSTRRAGEPADNLARPLLAWFELSGRHDLPWQRDRRPYAVWISEIMLQQTQVVTVIAYFERFMERFPALNDLAAANLDEVLALWSGLGYYARARNLHRAARMAVEQHDGDLPADLEGLMGLPGIGRSTAGAVLALAHGVRSPILDGNVKRVLARYHTIEGWSGHKEVERTLWRHADAHTPFERVADYTQAVMDLGATVCTRARPACGDCPLERDCEARRLGIEARLPASRPKRERPRRRRIMLLVHDGHGRVLLERRPATGIWGGLFSLPELDDADADADADAIAQWCDRHLGVCTIEVRELPHVQHAFTHFDLDIVPYGARLFEAPRRVMDTDSWCWYKSAAEPPLVGIATPVRALVESVANNTFNLDRKEAK